MMKQYNTGVLVLSALVLLSLVPGAQATDVDPLFLDAHTLDITLSGPFTIINRERDREEEYKGGTLTYLDKGREVSLDVKFRVRGNFRLRKDVCSHAQLWLDLDKDEVAGTLFENQNNLKLVVQCQSRRRYANYLVREHQLYQMYNAITDLSFLSRLVNVTFQDTDDNSSRTRFGMILEHKDRLAHRVGMKNVYMSKIDYRNLDPLQGTIAALFMYLAGNTDFSFISAHEDECCHNAKLLQPAGEKQFFPVPYDFDSSGYVDASYAEANKSLRLRSVRQRLYRGFCVPEVVMSEALVPFRTSAEQLLAIASDTRYMNESSAMKSVKYLNEFFSVINNPEELQDKILEKCRG